MENREEKDLREACSFADSFEYTTEEVEKCKTMRDNIIQLNEETDLMNAIKNGMRFEKGWLNSGVMHGDYDHYQKKEQIITDQLESALHAVKEFGTLQKVENDSIVEQGKVLLSLRAKLVEAVGTQDFDKWSSVEAILNESEKKSFFHPEIKAARQEVDYQKSVAEINEKLRLAIEAHDKDMLCILLHQAKQNKFRMDPKHNTYVKDGQELLDRIQSCIKKMENAIATLEEKLLIEACSDADSFDYQTEQVQKCKTLRDNVIELNLDATKGLDGKEQELLEKVIEKAGDIGYHSCQVRCKETAIRISECRKLARDRVASIETARKGIGATAEDFICLENIKQLAEELGGLSHYSDVNQAKEYFSNQKKEMELVKEVRNNMKCENGWLNNGIRHGDYDSYETAESIEYKSLDASLKMCEEFGTMNTIEGRLCVKQGKILRALREKLSQAVKTQNMEAWKDVENQLQEADNYLHDNIYSANSHIEQTMQLFIKEHPELCCARSELSYQKSVDKVRSALQSVIGTTIDEKQEIVLNDSLSKAKELEMLPKHNDLVARGKENKAHINSCRGKINKATSEVEEKLLIEACDDANSFGYCTLQVQECIELKDTVIQLNKDINEAKSIVYAEKLEDVVQRAEKISLKTKNVEECKDILLSRFYDKKKFYTLQLKAAERLSSENKEERKREIRMHGMLRMIDIEEAGDKYDWPYAPILNRSDEWARAQGMAMNKAKLAAGMHCYTKKAIKSPLTQLKNEGKSQSSVVDLDKQSIKEVLDCFKNIQRLSEGQQSMATEIVDTSMKSPVFVNEVYCQVLKQCTGNPDPESRESLWRLLFVLVNCIGPVGTNMQCVVEKYLRDYNAPAPYIEALHAFVFGGKEPDHPGDKKISDWFQQADIPNDNAHSKAEESKNVAKDLPTCCCCFG